VCKYDDAFHKPRAQSLASSGYLRILKDMLYQIRSKGKISWKANAIQSRSYVLHNIPQPVSTKPYKVPKPECPYKSNIETPGQAIPRITISSYSRRRRHAVQYVPPYVDIQHYHINPSSASWDRSRPQQLKPYYHLWIPR
jgi:hypothetical protein